MGRIIIDDLVFSGKRIKDFDYEFNKIENLIVKLIRRQPKIRDRYLTHLVKRELKKIES